MKNSLFLIALLLVVNTAKSANELDIELSSTNYRGKIDFKANISNVSKSQVLYSKIAIQRKGVSRWDFVRLDTRCTCKTICKKSPAQLKSGQTMTVQWDFKSDDCTPAQSGVYRLIIMRSSDIAYEVRGLSHEFFVQ